jgi:hypothetical protein
LNSFVEFPVVLARQKTVFTRDGGPRRRRSLPLTTRELGKDLSVLVLVLAFLVLITAKLYPNEVR